MTKAERKIYRRKYYAEHKYIEKEKIEPQSGLYDK